MIIRDTRDGGQFKMADWTQEINVIPNSWGFIGNMGLFQEESVTGPVVQFEEITQNGALIIDRVRGDRSTVGKNYDRKMHSFNIPHFPLDDYISPRDLQGVRAYGQPNEVEKLANVRARKMERIRRNHAWTLEAARAQVLTAGTVYAPSGTVSQNWFTEFGVTQTSVDFVFGTSATDIVGKIESVIAAIQDNAGEYGSTVTGVVFLCSPTWFAKLISHSKVVNAYQYYTTSGAQEPLRRRLGGNNTMHRVFEFAGATFIEMRDAYNGTALIPSGKAVAVPLGTDAFKTLFAPCDRFGFVNTEGEQVYMFEFEDQKGTKIEIETESNFINVIYRPALVIEATSSN
jgi:hypothetical protein